MAGLVFPTISKYIFYIKLIALFSQGVWCEIAPTKPNYLLLRLFRNFLVWCDFARTQLRKQGHQIYKKIKHLTKQVNIPNILVID